MKIFLWCLVLFVISMYITSLFLPEEYGKSSSQVVENKIDYEAQWEILYGEKSYTILDTAAIEACGRYGGSQLDFHYYYEYTKELRKEALIRMGPICIAKTPACPEGPTNEKIRQEQVCKWAAQKTLELDRKVNAAANSSYPTPRRHNKMSCWWATSIALQEELGCLNNTAKAYLYEASRRFLAK